MTRVNLPMPQAKGSFAQSVTPNQQKLQELIQSGGGLANIVSNKQSLSNLLAEKKSLGSTGQFTSQPSTGRSGLITAGGGQVSGGQQVTPPSPQGPPGTIPVFFGGKTQFIPINDLPALAQNPSFAEALRQPNQGVPDASQQFTGAAQPGGPGATPGLEKTFRSEVISPPTDIIGQQTKDVRAGQPPFSVPVESPFGNLPQFPSDFSRKNTGGRFGTELGFEKLFPEYNTKRIKPGKKGRPQDFGFLGGFGKGPEGKIAATAELAKIQQKLKESGSPFEAILQSKDGKWIVKFMGSPGSFKPTFPGEEGAGGAITTGTDTGALGVQPGEPGFGPPTPGTPGTLPPPPVSGTQPPIDTGPAGIGDPSTAIGTGMGSVQERNQFVQNVLNSLTEPLLKSQIEQFQTFTKAQNELRSSIEGFRQESPDAISKREGALQGFIDRGFRELNRTLGQNLRSRMNELRNSGFASTSLASHVLEETALRTYQQGTDDLLDRTDQMDLQIREQQSQQRSRELAGLTGIQGPSFPTNIPEIQFPPLGTFAPPTSFRDKLEGMKLAYFMATDIPGRSREERLKLFESIMNNTTTVMDSGIAGFLGQAAGTALGAFLPG